MEMSYDGALVMPSKFVAMSDEEMTYVEGGGWSTYKGLEAIFTITAICGCAVLAAGLTYKAGAAMVASAATGVGLIAALGLAIGVTLGIVATTYQFGLALCATINMVSSYKKYRSFSKSGFRACSYRVHGLEPYTPQLVNYNLM